MPTTVVRKHCIVCLVEKALTAFEPDRNTCRSCRNDRRNANRNLTIEHANQKSWRKNNPLIIRANKRRHYYRHKEKLLKLSRNNSLKRLYNITQEEYERLLQSQGGVCKICKTHPSKLKLKLCVDHCHGTGRVRGLLCHNCNRAIGLLRDDLDTVLSATLYLAGL